MTFREKVIFLVLIIVKIKNISCYPQTNLKSYSKENSPTNTNFISQHSYQTLNSEPIYKMFNFPEMEYSQASNNPFDFAENNKVTSLRTKLSTSSYSERNFNVKCNNMEKEFSTAPNYRDFGKFSDVEYPLTANEMWKPNYWNYPNNMNTFCQNQPTTSLKLNHTSTRNGLTNNFRKHCLPESVLSFSTKSYSDPKKNYMMLKNKQINNHINTLNINNETVLKNKDSSCIKNNYESQKLNIDKSINTYVDKCKKPVSGIEGLHGKDNFSNVCNNNDFFASDYETKLKHSENIVNSYADKFSEEMSPIIKFVADNIVLSNSKCSKEKMSRTKTDIDLPKSYAEDKSLSMCNPTLENTENLVKLYADEFNHKMSAIIKSTADKCFSQNTEIPIVNYNLQSFNQEIKDFEPDYENKIKLCGDSIDSYADRFNDEMTSALNAKFNDIFFGNLQCPKEIDEKYLLNENSAESVCQVKCKKTVSGIEGLHGKNNFSNVCNNNDFFASDYETKLKHSENIVNSYANKFYEEMSPIIKFFVDNIVLSNSKCSKEKMGRKEFKTDIDLPKSYADDKSLSMCNPTLENTENLVKLYADEFNHKMSAIIKSTADKCFSQNTEIPIVNYNLQSFNQEIKDFEPDYEDKIKLCGDSIDSYADRFNDEMTSALNAKFNDIFFGNLQCPKEIDEKYLLNENSAESVCQVKQNYPLEEPYANINNTHLKSNSPAVCIENVNVKENRITYNENILLENSDTGLENEKQENINELKDNTFFSNEEFTTDAYPESDNPLSYALSTVAPTKSILDSNVIEPEKYLYPDELEQYFMLVE